MENNFENEVIQRLTVIETEIKNLSNYKNTTYENQRKIMLIEQYINDLKRKTQNLSVAFLSLVGALILAIIKYQLHI